MRLTRLAKGRSKKQQTAGISQITHGVFFKTYFLEHPLYPGSCQPILLIWFYHQISSFFPDYGFAVPAVHAGQT